MRPWLMVAGDFVTTGGMDAANHALASYLARQGRQVGLVAHRVDPALAARPGVRVRRVPRPLGSHALGFPLLDRAGRRAAREGGILLVNGGNCRAPSDACWLHYVHAAFEPRHPGSPLRQRWSALGRRRALADERAAVARARVVIANSSLTAGHAIDLLGADPARVHVVRYGADAERFRPPTAAERAAARRALGLDARPVAVFIGALGDHRKGFDALARAWSGTGDAVLLVIGSGAAKPRWEQWVRERGLADRIRFLGFQGDVRPLLWAADALVAPTRYEAWGLAVQEALCCGLPAVVSSGAGVAAALPEALAPLRLADPDDAAGLAAALERWRADPAGWRVAAAEASGELRGWSWDDMAARIVDIVEAPE